MGPLISGALSALGGLGGGGGGPTTQTATSGAPVNISLGDRNLGAGSGTAPAGGSTVRPVNITVIALAALGVVAAFLAFFAWSPRPSTSRPRRRR